jgi:hypothetical protein
MSEPVNGIFHVDNPVSELRRFGAPA